MNVEKVKEQLAELYPGGNIKENPNEMGEISEVVCEIDRATIDSDRDVAVVVADKSAEHWHNIITEEYEVLRGTLKVFQDGHVTSLKERETITIKPGTRHSVEGNETWFYCYSVPDWFPGDLHLTETKT
jgi:mannose-6-phosphate isomerase-like protein (cupin superfamily)